MNSMLYKSLKIIAKGLPYRGTLPDFLIIGAQKCGTTSLYNHLIKHPSIYPASVKEVGFFDRYFTNSIKWYRSQFPSVLRKYYTKWVLRQPFFTGEASTGYILNPHSLMRINKIIPRAKLIALLRNPVERAYSHYQHTVRIKRESLSFEEAIAREDERIGEAWQRMRSDENYYNFDIALYAYLRTGMYIEQLVDLMSLFPRNQVLILNSEAFRADPSNTFRNVFHFLGMPVWQLTEFTKYNRGKYFPMDSSTKKKLQEYFRPYNQRLYEYLGVDFDWEKESDPFQETN